MTMVRTVSVALIASFLIAALPKTAFAGDGTTSPATVDLRAAIDRAAAQSVAESRDASSHAPMPIPARARRWAEAAAA